MRIHPVIRAHILSNSVPRYVSKVNQNNYVTEYNMSFGGKVNWYGAIGTVIGTFAGIGLGAIATIATGGLAAPIIAGMAGAAAGGIGGSALDNKINKNDSESSPGNGGCGGDDVDSDYENARMNNY